MLNLQNETFLNGLDKLNTRKVNTIKSSNIVCIFFICISKGQEFVLDYARLTSSKETQNKLQF